MFSNANYFFTEGASSWFDPTSQAAAAAAAAAANHHLDPYHHPEFGQLVRYVSSLGSCINHVVKIFGIYCIYETPLFWSLLQNKAYVIKWSFVKISPLPHKTDHVVYVYLLCNIFCMLCCVCAKIALGAR